MECEKTPFYCSQDCEKSSSAPLSETENKNENENSDGNTTVKCGDADSSDDEFEDDPEDEENVDIEELKYRIKKRDTLINQYLDQIEQLKDQSKRYRDDMKSKLDAREKSAESNEVEIIELKAEIDDLKKKNNVVIKHRDAASKRIVSLEKSNSELETKLASLEKNNIDLENKLKNHVTINNEILQTEVTGSPSNQTPNDDLIRGKVARLEEDLIGKQKLLDEAKSTIAKSKKEIDSLKKQCADLECKVAEAQNKETLNLESLNTLTGELRCERTLSQQLRTRIGNNPQPISDTNNEPTTHDSSEVCAQEFQFPGSCTRAACPFNHQFDKTKPGVCIVDFERKGECRRGERCKFSHDTPQALRNDPVFKKHIANRKEETFGICFYDYFEKGSCPRSDKKCRFSHKCSQERRDNPFIRDSMLRRMNSKLKNPPNPAGGHQSNIAQVQSASAPRARDSHQAQGQPWSMSNGVVPPALPHLNSEWSRGPPSQGPPAPPRMLPPTIPKSTPTYTPPNNNESQGQGRPWATDNYIPPAPPAMLNSEWSRGPPSQGPPLPPQVMPSIIPKSTLTYTPPNNESHQLKNNVVEQPSPSLQTDILNIIKSPTFQSAIQNAISQQLLQCQPPSTTLKY